MNWLCLIGIHDWSPGWNQWRKKWHQCQRCHKLKEYEQ
jgi:hypothetical protein